MQETTLGDGTTTWALLRAESVHGRGVAFPRIAFLIRARTPRERMTVQLPVLRGEILGQGLLTGSYIYSSDAQLTLEVPVSPACLEYLDRSVIGSRIDVTLRLSGWLRGRDDNTDGRRFANSPEAGEWIFQGFGEGRQTDLTFQVARSDWFSQVLEPIGTLNYICTEIALPRGLHALRQATSLCMKLSEPYAKATTPRYSRAAERPSRRCLAHSKVSTTICRTRASGRRSTTCSIRRATTFTSGVIPRARARTRGSSALITVTQHLR